MMKFTLAALVLVTSAFAQTSSANTVQCGAVKNVSKDAYEFFQPRACSDLEKSTQFKAELSAEANAKVEKAFVKFASACGVAGGTVKENSRELTTQSRMVPYSTRDGIQNWCMIKAVAVASQVCVCE